MKISNLLENFSRLAHFRGMPEAGTPRSNKGNCTIGFRGVKQVAGSQIHQQKEKRHLVGVSGKPGYDGERSNQSITNEVQLLWAKGHCLSSMRKTGVPRA